MEFLKNKLKKIYINNEIIKKKIFDPPPTTSIHCTVIFSLVILSINVLKWDFIISIGSLHIPSNFSLVIFIFISSSNTFSNTTWDVFTVLRVFRIFSQQLNRRNNFFLFANTVAIYY